MSETTNFSLTDPFTLYKSKTTLTSRGQKLNQKITIPSGTQLPYTDWVTAGWDPRSQKISENELFTQINEKFDPEKNNRITDLIPDPEKISEKHLRILKDPELFQRITKEGSKNLVGEKTPSETINLVST